MHCSKCAAGTCRVTRLPVRGLLESHISSVAHRLGHIRLIRIQRGEDVRSMTKMQCVAVVVMVAKVICAASFLVCLSSTPLALDYIHRSPVPLRMASMRLVGSACGFVAIAVIKSHKHCAQPSTLPLSFRRQDVQISIGKGATAVLR